MFEFYGKLAPKNTILLVANTSWYIWNFRRALVEDLIGQGFDVWIVAARDEYTSPLRKMGCRVRTMKFPRAFDSLPVEIFVLARLWRIIGEIRPFCVMSHGPKVNLYCGILTYLHSIPTVSNISGLGILKIRGRFVRYVNLFLYRILLRRNYYVFVQNSEDLELFRRKRIVTQDNSELVMGSGVDLDQFPYFPLSATRPPVIRFGYVGRLLRSKGVLDLVKAFRILSNQRRDVELHIYGLPDPGNPDSVDVKKISAGMERVFYHGRSDNVPEALKDIHCFVYPSYYGEGVAKVLIEAIATGRVIVTTDSAGCREAVIEGTNGYFCRGRDPNDIYAKMNAIIEDCENWPTMSLASRGLAEARFDVGSIVASYRRVLRALPAGNNA